jgi:hypothetical protein
MIYWSLGTGRKFAVIAFMFGLSATTLLILQWLIEGSLLKWKALLGGMSFLTIPPVHKKARFQWRDNH